MFGPGRQLFEIQIRTREMHRTAEYGIAAHWLYKEGANRNRPTSTLHWFRQVLEFQLDAKNPAEFFEFLKLDLYQDEIFVFTPTGDVHQLPRGATPIDFAFAVHTEVGLHSQGAKVNGRIAPLSRELKSSDTVEIITSPNARPSRDWLAHVRTGPRAPPDPPVAPPGGADAPRRASAATSSSAKCAAAASRSRTTTRSRPPRSCST